MERPSVELDRSARESGGGREGRGAQPQPKVAGRIVALDGIAPTTQPHE